MAIHANAQLVIDTTDDIEVLRAALNAAIRYADTKSSYSGWSDYLSGLRNAAENVEEAIENEIMFDYDTAFSG